MQKRAIDHPPARPEVLPLEATGITIARNERTLLDRVDLRIADDPRITVLLGPNGAGKSLLIRVLAGLIDPDQGSVTWAASAPDRARMRTIGFVSQKPVLLSRSVMANMDYVLALSGVAKGVRARAAHAALARARLEHLSNQDARSLSAGEQQRLALARAIAAAPRILILDEPTANLDPASTAAIEQRLVELRDGGTPVLFITHDLAQARRIADDVVFMHAGKILEQRPAAEFFRAAQSEHAQRFIRGELLTSPS